MKVCVISHNYPSESQQAQGKIIKDELDLLADTFEIVLIKPQVKAPNFTPQSNRSKKLVYSDYQKHIIRYISIPQKLLPNVTSYFLSKAIIPFINEIKPDLVHIHWLFPSGLIIPTIKKLGYPVIQTIHGSDWWLNKSLKRLQKLIKSTFVNADKIITVGTRLREDIINTYPTATHKIVTINHAIDTDLFNLPEKKRILKETVNLLTVANFFHVKGLDILIDSLHELVNRQNYNIRTTLIAGTSDKKYKRMILQKIQSYNLTDRIRILESLSQKDLTNYYHEADFFVLPSRSEGFGLALAEAAATGLPLVSTYSGGPEQIINSDKMGLLVPVDDSIALADGIAKLIHTITDFKSDSIRETIVERYSKNQKFLSLKKIYNEVIKE